MTGHPQAMSAERIEKAARAIAPLEGSGVLRIAEAALRAAYPELADGSSVILPREATPEMLAAVENAKIEVGPGPFCIAESDARTAYRAMRDAALSAPDST